MSSEVAHPESIVTTQWVEENLGDANLRLVEVDVDTEAYSQGHIPGAIGWNWTSQLNDGLTRDILSKEQIEELLGDSGIDGDTTVVLYGDNNNWFATYAFWQLRIYGHQQVKIMDGGRQKWVDEGRALTTDAPSVDKKAYSASNPDPSIRATRDLRPGRRLHQQQCRLGGRPVSRRVQRHSAGAAGLPSRGRPAWRTHSRRGQYPVVDRRQR